jgi:hypothetical protein
MKTADEGQDSVWTKLGKLYCRLEPDGKYRDLSDSVVLCSESRRERRKTGVSVSLVWIN